MLTPHLSPPPLSIPPPTGQIDLPAALASDSAQLLMSSIAAVGGAHAAVAALTGGSARPDWWDESDAAAIHELLRAFE